MLPTPFASQNKYEHHLPRAPLYFKRPSSIAIPFPPASHKTPNDEPSANKQPQHCPTNNANDNPDTYAAAALLTHAALATDQLRAAVGVAITVGAIGRGDFADAPLERVTCPAYLALDLAVALAETEGARRRALGRRHGIDGELRVGDRQRGEDDEGEATHDGGLWGFEWGGWSAGETCGTSSLSSAHKCVG